MRTLIAAAVCAAMIAPVQAVAQEEEFKVSYSDLDLTTEAGQKKLDARITTAARKFCGFHQHTTGSRMKSDADKACLRSTTKSAREQIARSTGVPLASR